MASPGQWLADPTGFTNVATQARTATDKVLLGLWEAMKPGETADLAPGDYAHAKFKVSPRGIGAWPILFRGSPFDQGHSRILQDAAVGGSDTIGFFPGAGDVKFSRLWIQADDRSGVFTEIGGVSNVYFNLCTIFGSGYAYDPNWKNGSKWGMRLYNVANWNLDTHVIGEIFDEHAIYTECNHGDFNLSNFAIRHCGRTALQAVNRVPPDGQGQGFGDINLSSGVITDVCLADQGGGSAIHLAGGMPTSRVNIDSVAVNLGNDQALAYPFNKNITGAIACARGGGAADGGLAELNLSNFYAVVGLVFPGVSGARRVNVSVADCDLFTMKNCYLRQGPKAFPIALEIMETVGEVQIDLNTQILGQIKFHGATYADLLAFKTAHPECFS